MCVEEECKENGREKSARTVLYAEGFSVILLLPGYYLSLHALMKQCDEKASGISVYFTVLSFVVLFITHPLKLEN